MRLLTTLGLPAVGPVSITSLLDASHGGWLNFITL
jgi:hypothetical protein